MGRTLRYLGWVFLAATAWLVLADLAGWVPAGASDRWTMRGITFGLGSLAAGTLLRLFTPIRREIARDRCMHCGAPTEHGHHLCRDHLKAALDEARDRTRKTLQAGPDPKRSDFSSS
jgi:hypothetical protein